MIEVVRSTKKSLGISRNRCQELSTAKYEHLKKRNRFKFAGKNQNQLRQKDFRDIEAASTSRESIGQQSSVEYSRSLEIYEEAKQNLKEVAELRKQITTQVKARMTAFKQTETRKLDENICKLSRKAVKHILIAQQHLNEIRKFGGSTDVQEKYFRNMEKSLTLEIRETSKGLRTQQKEYFDRLKAYQSHTNNVDIQLSENEKQKMRDPFEDGTEVDLSIQKGQNEQRNKQLTELVKSIQQLTGVYKQLNELVIEQGSIIDRIDVNIQQTFTHVEKANQHLKGANQQASSPFAEKCMLSLFAAILIVAVILGFKYSRH